MNKIQGLGKIKKGVSEEKNESKKRIKCLEQKLSEKRKEQKKYRNYRKPNIAIELLFWGVISTLALTICPHLIVTTIYDGSIPLCETFLGTIKMTTFVRLCSIAACVPFFALVGTFSYIKTKSKAQINEGLLGEIEYLEEEIKKERQKQSRKKMNTHRMKIPKKTAKEQTSEIFCETETSLNRRLELIYMLNNYREFLLKKKEEGTLREELQKKGLSKEEIEQSILYLEKRFCNKRRK